MSLKPVQKTYERLGREDPLYGVLAWKGLRHNKWDPVEFFQTGEREIGEVLRYVEDLGLPLRHDRALDFGCGVGRLSQALAQHFERVVGVDIAESMVQRAREYNRYGERVSYVVNTGESLALLDAGVFDFVYSNITLQHMPPEPAKNYIREFLRVLRPGGVAIFQVPNGKPYRAGSLRGWLYTLRRRHLRRMWKIVRRRPPYEMHYIPRGQVEGIIEQSGGRLVHVLDLGEGRKLGKNLRYCATAAGGGHAVDARTSAP